MMRGIKENTLLVDISSIRHVSCHYLKYFTSFNTSMTVDFTVKYKQKNDILVYNCHFKRLAFFHILRFPYILNL